MGEVKRGVPLQVAWNVQAPIDQANEQAVRSDWATVIAGLKEPSHGYTRAATGERMDVTAEVTGGRALLAERSAVRVGSDAVDREAGEASGRAHLGRIKLDHPVVRAVADSGDSADGAVVSAFGDDRRAGSTTVTGGEPDQLASVIVADGGQGAVASLDDDARTAAEDDLVVSDRQAWSAHRCDRDGNRHHGRSGETLPECHGGPV